ncbi:MAG: DNA cytosine methyltransferase [Candidatus Thorarchaeota archaeon]
MSSLTAIDLFAGAGGSSAGLHAAGYEVVLAIDNDPIAAKAYQLNFPEAVILVQDIREVHGIELFEILGKSPDLLTASPPCEEYSRANSKRKKRPLDRLFNTESGRLILDAIRLIGDLTPNHFIIENVPGMWEGDLREALAYEFERVGVSPEELFATVFSAQNYGIPNRRRRVFITNFPVNLIHLPAVPCQKVLNLPDSTPDRPLINHEAVHIPPKYASRLHKAGRKGLITFQGANQTSLASHQRLYPEEVAPTVMGKSRFVHPFDLRLLTVREMARLQGFPDDHIFFGSIEEQINQVGEAVPPPLAAGFGMEALRPS